MPFLRHDTFWLFWVLQKSSGMVIDVQLTRQLESEHFWRDSVAATEVTTMANIFKMCDNMFVWSKKWFSPLKTSLFVWCLKQNFDR